MRRGSGWHKRAAASAALVAAGCIPQAEAPLAFAPPAPRAEHVARRDTPSRTAPVERSGGDRVRAIDLPDPAVQPSPARPARQVTADAATIADATVTARDGDTLAAIARRTGAGAAAIARANGLAPGQAPHAGQRLAIPGGRYHAVKQGETGVAIARAYGVAWSDVVTLNDLQPPYILHTGDRLLLPSPAQVARYSVEDRARAFQLDIDDLVTGSEPAIASNAKPARATASPRQPVPAERAVAEPPRFAGRFDWPIEGKLIGRFGPAGDGRRNDGINIAADRGDPIRAAADGVVAYAGSAIAVYGGLILLKHGDGWITAYGHAEQILVTRGQAVKRGDIIARAGATGSVNRPQLHFEIRDKRTPVDPLRYLPDRG